jgi:hypothetical protein
MRLFKLNRYTDALTRVRSVLKSKSYQLFCSFSIVIILMLLSSVLMYYIENDAQPDVFENAFSGLWWAIATVTTVGYGDIYPITGLGKILGAFIAILGIGLIAVPTGIISAGFVEQLSNKKNEDKKTIVHIVEKNLNRKIIYTKKMKAEKTAHNRTVSASPPVCGSASTTARSFRYASFPRRCSGTFCQPWSCYASPYSGWQNVANSRNVMRNLPLPIFRKKDT